MLNQHHFERHELEAMTHALQWQDVFSTLLADAAATAEPEKSKLTKLAMDAATTATISMR